MKKISLLFFLLSSIGMTFAYTGNDVLNATYLVDQSIVVRQNADTKYRLDDRVLRQEIIGMALNIKGVPLPENYVCKKYFSDATKNDWVCRALEIAADNGMITRANTKARPTDFVTRAEALAILLKTGKVSLTSPRKVTQADGSVWSLYSDLQKLGFTRWQADMMDSLPSCLVINHGISCEDGADSNTAIAQFKPNTLALRSEVFEFSALMSGFIAGDDSGGALDDLDVLLPQTTVPTDQNHLTPAALKDLLKDEPVQTVSASPKVALIVFSDFECPFCVKLFKDVIAPVIADASTDTALIYKNYPLPYHTNAFIWAVESECVAKNLGSVAFFDYVHKRYADQNASVSDIAPDLTLEQMTTCRLTDDTIGQRIAAEQALGVLYKVDGTPTTLVVNTRTGYYETIVGAYPKSVFDTAIQAVKDHK